jgi:hypothetical protein
VPIWPPTTKSQESPWFTCVEVTCYIFFKSFRGGLQLCFRPDLNQRFSQKIMGFQSCGSFNFRNFGTFGTKWHLGAGLVPSTKNTIRRKVVAPPNSGRDEFCESNLLCGLCRFMWIIDMVVTHSNPHLGSPTRPSTAKCCKLKNVPRLLFPLFPLLNSHLNLSRSVRVC